jgi:hypothetical protein
VVVACLFVGAALLEVVANTAVAVTPSDTWTPEQTSHYVQAQQRVSDLTGHPLAENVKLGYALPNWAPADQLFVEGYCDSVWISDGEAGYGLEWLLVERGPDKSLCQTLVHDRLAPVLRTSLVEADAAFLQEEAHYYTYLILLHQNVKGAGLARANSRLIGALRQFDVSLEHVLNVGLPHVHARILTVKLLADSGSAQRALANAAGQNDQNEAAVARWIRDVHSQFSRTISEYTLLLHDLVAPATD